MEVNVRGYDLLIKKLDQFIRKYYVNKLIRGVLYTIALLLALFLLFTLLEHYFYFNKGVRKVLFTSYILTSVAAVGYWVVLPLYHYLGLGKVISHEQAAHIIGSHFGDVKDKLLNVLQLARERGSADTALLAASIEQKTESIKLVPFQSAIDLNQNRKYLRYALPPLLLLIVILFAAPSLIKDSTTRIINNDKDYERAAPFSFTFQEDNPEVLQDEDYLLEVTVEGDVLPAEAFIEVDNFQYRLAKKDNSTYTYTFRNLHQNTPFRVFSGRVSSPEKEITVLARPSIVEFHITLDYPAYTGRKDEVISNIGDLAVPEGTHARWSFNTAFTDAVHIEFGESPEEQAQRKSSDTYSIDKVLLRDQLYRVLIQNSHVQEPEAIAYSIAVKEDEYPVISVENFQDSLEQSVVYFVGNASDDYGISSLNFHYTVTDQQGRTKLTEVIPMEGASGRDRQYAHTFDINTLELAPGDRLSYYFEVKDNDAVNGRKSAKTGIMNYEKPTIEALKKQEKENSAEIKEHLEKSIENMKKLQEQYKKLREDLLQKKELNWQDKKELEKLLEEQRKIQEKLEKAQEKFKENLENSKDIKEKSEELKEKEEKLNELFEEALDDEKKDLLEKIEQLLQELEKENSLEMMEQMEMNNENKEMDMNRLLELYKQLEVEKEAQDIQDELEKMAEEQEKLAEETEQQEKPQENLQEEQENLNEKMEQLKQDMQELEKKNEELKRPKELGKDNEEQMEDIQQDMQNSEEQLEQQNNQDAAKSQKQAAEKMRKMASSLQQSMAGGDQEQQKEDAKLLRQLLENLVTISFDQETLADNFTKVNTIAPQYVDYVQTQFKLKDDFKIVEDSLVALANRNDQIQGFVLDKVSEVKGNMESSITYLEDRKTASAMNNQRRSMTGLNDLALMLSESLENMQQSMAQSMPGDQMCTKPGSNTGKPGKVPSDKISEGQEKLGEKLQQMMQNQKNGKGNSSKDFAEAAARQAAMRKALQDMQKDLKEQGQGSKELEQIIEEMNKNEIDLVNKRLDGELLKRQQEITTRLLEADKAERKREFDNKRKAETATEVNRELPPSLKAYLKKREAETQMYKTVSPELRPYYRNLVDDYYRSLKKTN